MYDLLQEKFDDSDVTFRHLESQEFKDFVKVFKLALNGIQNNTKDLSKYAKQMIDISKQDFTYAKTDKDIVVYKLEQHQKWEKFIHLKDKGCN
jgi:diacylglycerol kinase family enzyme